MNTQVTHGGTTWTIFRTYMKGGEAWHLLTRTDIMGRRHSCTLPARYCFAIPA